MRLIVFLLSFIFLTPQQSGKHRLVVNVTGLNPLKGELYLSLHERPEYFHIADSAFMKIKIAVDKETETVIFEKVPDGRYAIAVYHDENLNGKLDANEIGVPKEGYGFSNNPKAPGRPKFEQAAFDVDRNDTVGVKMIYPKVIEKNKDHAK
jgi:uncharacterized protein (DUF2141 family)